MRIALIVPGGVDRSGEFRVIPALLSLIARLSRTDDVEVIALAQEPRAATWNLAGVRIHNIGARANVAASLLKIHRLHHALPFDLVHSIWSGRCGFVAVAAAKLIGVPSFVHVAGGELAAIPHIRYGGARSRFGRMREQFILRRASAVSAASAPIIESLRSIRVCAHRIPLGVDPDLWPPRVPARRNCALPARLIHVASLNPVKDQATLLRALALLADDGCRFEMHIVGEDTMGGEIQALCARLSCSRQVRFHGFLTHTQLRTLMKGCDLMVHSSRHEAGPVALLEAAMMGIPAVGTLVGHFAEWAPHAALTVPVGDFAALAQSVRRVISDEDLRLSLAREALELALDADAERTIREFRTLYASVITARQSPT